MKIFISYTARHPYDRGLAKRLAEALRTAGIDCFYDQDCIESGARLTATISLALQTMCTHLVVIVSSASEKSEWVQREVHMALNVHADIRIVPLRLGREVSFPALDDVKAVICEQDQNEVDLLFDALNLPRLSNESTMLRSSEIKRSRGLTNARLLPSLCDRTREERSFAETFSAGIRLHPGSAHACFLLGDDDAQHASFAERIRHTYLTDYARHLAAKSDKASLGSVEHYKVHWPSWWPSGKPVEAVVANLFDAFLYGYSQNPSSVLDQTALTRVLEDINARVLVFEHEIALAQWRKDTEAVIESYLRYWRDVSASQQIIVFFDIVHTSDDDKALRDRMQQLVSTLAQKSWRPRSPFVPAYSIGLPCVSRKDVEEWFRQIEDDEVFVATTRECDEMFDDDVRKCLPMSRIEMKLRKVVRETMQRGIA
jgi:hypothetical protein